MTEYCIRYKKSRQQKTPTEKMINANGVEDALLKFGRIDHTFHYLNTLDYDIEMEQNGIIILNHKNLKQNWKWSEAK